MKIKNEAPPQKFTPIKIVLESPDEVAKVFALFNDIPLMDALGLDACELTNLLENANDVDAQNPPIVSEPWDKAVSSVLRPKPD